MTWEDGAPWLVVGGGLTVGLMLVVFFFWWMITMPADTSSAQDASETPQDEHCTLAGRKLYRCSLPDAVCYVHRDSGVACNFTSMPLEAP